MDHSQYLTSMGITLCRRALFSYTSQPQGSYGLHVIFRKFVKEKKILMHDRDRDNWCAFLSDYIVFRLYIAKYILKDYAKDYTPLLHISKASIRLKMPSLPSSGKRQTRGVRSATSPSSRRIWIRDTGQRKWTISTISSMLYRPKWKKSRWNGISG